MFFYLGVCVVEDEIVDVCLQVIVQVDVDVGGGFVGDVDWFYVYVIQVFVVVVGDVGECVYVGWCIDVGVVQVVVCFVGQECVYVYVLYLVVYVDVKLVY